MRAAFSPLPDLETLASRWKALEARARPSFFLGWTWTGAWLASSGARPELLSVTDDRGQDVALALVGFAPEKRRLGGVPTAWWNQSGVPALDRPFIEYNGLLQATDADENAVAQAAIAALMARNDWRALHLAGIAPDHPLLRAAKLHRATRTDISPAYAVDLAAVRAAGSDYLSLLSTNSRSQIRRSIKDYPGIPGITAATEQDVPLWLEEMRALNTGRHADNAWESDTFRAFAAEIVARGLPKGTVELLRFHQGEALLGYLLNFVHDGRAMNYQSAFAEPISAKAKPGLMCHAAAVARYADRGLALYSLLAGKDRYKQSLSTTEETLEWWVLERFSPRLEAEHMLRRLFSRPASV